MLVGERLKAIRESKKMSQSDVEEKTGLLRCYLSRCEDGHTVRSVETLERWSRALGITMSQLLVGDGREAEPLPGLKKRNASELSRALRIVFDPSKKPSLA
jgi:transcriptional regulator with XRE-family HTH domain